ncbi:hypothetical protein BY996DRAFT_6502068 [Phakopsora pachyrhizi]|nr:hypothetical protein BY996DRAFT_6502068 [Phakopsora pachyrhizi]
MKLAKKLSFLASKAAINLQDQINSFNKLASTLVSGLVSSTYTLSNAFSSDWVHQDRYKTLNGLSIRLVRDFSVLSALDQCGMPTKEQLTRVTTDTKIPKADRNRLGQAAEPAGTGGGVKGSRMGVDNHRAHKARKRAPKKNVDWLTDKEAMGRKRQGGAAQGETEKELGGGKDSLGGKRRTDIRYIGKAVVERRSDRTVGPVGLWHWAVKVGRRARRRHTVVQSSYHFRVGAKVNSTPGGVICLPLILIGSYNVQVMRELFNEPLIPVKLSHWAWTVPDTSAKGIGDDS